MANRRVTRLTVSDDTCAQLTALFFEAQLGVECVGAGIEMLAARPDAPKELQILSPTAKQVGEAMRQFHAAYTDLLASGETSDA